MGAPQEILKLVERFHDNRKAYVSDDYKETRLRIEFLDPFFKTLGWDVNNENGYAEAYKDVIHEDAIKVGSATEAPDYCFRIGGARKFFTEAKKPSVNIKEAIHPAFKLRRYAWSSKLPLSILTDFDEFAVYDCRSKPCKDDSASTGRIMYLTFDEYPEKWNDISSVFSREAILKGSFDKYAEGVKGKKGTASVDSAFLEEIERWRDILSKNIALRNSQLSTRELNFAVQKTIDRIIFLRICEDRGIEHYGKLGSINGVNIYDRLVQHFRTADDKYNSGLFHFSQEKDRPEEPDYLTLNLKIDDKTLKDIISNLYYPESPYEFSVLPSDILGQVYEQFLGKVIRLTEGHQAKVEEKPEVRKAGGVYYTPTYIVDYIVQNTVGKLLDGRKVDSKVPLRILDPACGSGSFLIVAYQYLLDWYLKQYGQNQEKWSKGKNPKVRFSSKGDWRLTINERKRILLEHIYGVDIDSQAVEVTKLSLLLKVLEGENEETMQGQLFHERALPDLGQNIKCGNSLIGSDFYKNQQGDLFNEEEMLRVNAFDWEKEFADIFKAGGFDAVIGNPPYIRIQILQEGSPEQASYLKDHYMSASSGNYDIYVTFVEKGLALLNKAAKLGLILPHKFFNSKYGEPIRSIISKGKNLSEIVHFGEQQVFQNATTYTCLLFLDRRVNNTIRISKVNDLKSWRENGTCLSGTVNLSETISSEWNFNIDENASLLKRLKSFPLRLKDIANIFVGTQTSADDVYVLESCSISDKNVTGFSKALNEKVIVEVDCTVPFLRGKEIRRFLPLESTSRLICPYKITKDDFQLYSQDEMSRCFPMSYDYLGKNRDSLAKREKGKFKGDRWYAFGYPKSMTLFQNVKLVIPDYNNEASFTLDTKGHFYKTGYGIILKDPAFSYQYVLGLLNSKLIFQYLLSIGTSLRGGYVRFWTQYLEQLPIQPTPKSDNISPLVTKMLELNRKLSETKEPSVKTALQRQIEATDKQIDQLVYELYGLTEEEIKIVEG